MTRIQRETIASVLIVGFGIVMLVWAIPTYTPPYPGYGASPSLVANVSVGIIIVMALLALIRLYMDRFMGKKLPVAESQFPEEAQSTGFTQVGRVNLSHLAKFIIPSVLLVLGIEYIGYIPASLAFLMVIQYFIGSRKWLQMVVLSIALVAVLYIIMRYGFGVPIPGPQLF